jgi:hypothetical protein
MRGEGWQQRLLLACLWVALEGAEAAAGGGKQAVPRRSRTSAEKSLADGVRLPAWLTITLVVLCAVGPAVVLAVVTIARDESTPRIWDALKKAAKSRALSFLGSSSKPQERQE